jgi:hypothetical protein
VGAGRIETIGGLESLKDVPGLDLVTVNRDAGESVDWRLGLQDIVYQVYGSGDDYDEIERQCALVDRAVSVTYSNGLEPVGGADFEVADLVDAVVGQLQRSA